MSVAEGNTTQDSPGTPSITGTSDEPESEIGHMLDAMRGLMIRFEGGSRVVQDSAVPFSPDDELLSLNEQISRLYSATREQGGGPCRAWCVAAAIFSAHFYRNVPAGTMAIQRLVEVLETLVTAEASAPLHNDAADGRPAPLWLWICSVGAIGSTVLDRQSFFCSHVRRLCAVLGIITPEQLEHNLRSVLWPTQSASAGSVAILWTRVTA
jgi:hypothetical protein